MVELGGCNGGRQPSPCGPANEKYKLAGEWGRGGLKYLINCPYYHSSGRWSDMRFERVIAQIDLILDSGLAFSVANANAFPQM